MIIAAIIIFLIPTFYKAAMNSVRYETPEESFEKSAPRGTELVEILEDNGIALVIYKKNNGEFTTEIISQNQKGWSPIHMEYNYKKSKITDKGVVYLSIIDEKYVVHVSTLVKKEDNFENIIYDSLDSKFILCSYEFGDMVSVEGLLVIEGAFPDDYKVTIDGLEISLY